MLLKFYVKKLSLLPIIPPALIQSLQHTTGFNEEAFINVHQEPAVTSLRFQPSKFSVFCQQYAIDHLQLPITNNVPWCPHAYYLAERPSFTFDPLFHAGLYYVQEASSMFLWQVLLQTTGNDVTGKKVLDLCAAPGGKSTLLSAFFKDGLVVSNEIIKSRAAVLSENITKWGNENVVVTNNDPAHFKRTEYFFDVLLIDAPCSGSGLFRKDKNAVDEWSEEAVNLCSLRQQRIVVDAYSCLKKDGILIYATCSYSSKEDEDISDWIMDRFHVSSLGLEVKTEWNIVETKSSKHKAKGYRFYPDKAKGEGFFIAAFKKNDGSSFDSLSKNTIPTLTKRETESWRSWIRPDKSLSLLKPNNFIIAVPEIMQQHLAVLQKHLYIKQAGIILGEIKGKDVVPHHALAVSNIASHSLFTVPLNKEEAIRFLQKKEIERDVSSLSKGWHLATYCGIGLGWLKVLPNRINNYYPPEWRILKN